MTLGSSRFSSWPSFLATDGWEFPQRLAPNWHLLKPRRLGQDCETGNMAWIHHGGQSLMDPSDLE